MSSNATMSEASPIEGRCVRCVGLLVREWFEDGWVGERGQGQRCINCGHREGGRLLVCQKLYQDVRELSPGKSAPRRKYPRGAVSG